MKTIAWLLLLVPTLVAADEVHLKGAGVFSGRIVEHTDEMIKIDIGDGIIGLPTARVDHVVKGRSALDEHDERAKRLKPDDAGGWRNLGRWSLEHGLATQSRRAYQKVIEVVPGDTEAREALGYVYLDGHWVTEEESFRAQGYVEYEGEWMTPAEAQMAQSAADAHDARREAEGRAVDAEIAARDAEDRAQEAEERAQEAEDRARTYSYNPVYWGGWGYGVNAWPSTPVVSYR